MAEDKEATTVVGANDSKTKYGYRVVLAGLVVTVIAFAIAAASFDDAPDVVQVLGPVMTVIGTIVGTFFGLSLGASGRDQATDAAIKMAVAAPPEAAARTLGLPTPPK